MPFSLQRIIETLGGNDVVLGGICGFIFHGIVLFFIEENCGIFYLTTISIVNVIQSVTDFILRLFFIFFQFDSAELSYFYCKIRLYFLVLSFLSSLTYSCLSIIHRYSSQIRHQHIQKYFYTKLIRSLATIFSFIWLLNGILYLIYPREHLWSLSTHLTCSIQHENLFHLDFLLFFSIPILFTFILCFSVYYKTRLIPYEDLFSYQDLISRVYLQIILNNLSIFPYTIGFLTEIFLTDDKPTVIHLQIPFDTTQFLIFFYTYFTCPFLIYWILYRRRLQM